MKSLKEYKDFLYGCRFCTMCKPAAEVANLTQLESHTTRARALLLWRIAEGQVDWKPREVELLYQSTLDSISQAWCVVDYPVSEYILAARAEVFAAGLSPISVRQALEREISYKSIPFADTLLLACESAELCDPNAAVPMLDALASIGIPAASAVVPSGSLPYTLGDLTRATSQAQSVIRSIKESKARLVIADSPQTLWAIRQMYPALGISLPDEVAITSFSDLLADFLGQGQNVEWIPALKGKSAFFHDCRSAALVADTMPIAEVIQPGYTGQEDTLGNGAVFESPRRVIEVAGMKRIFSAWSRGLCKSCGADDGLWLTYPSFAQGLARQRLDEANRLGVDVLVTDSLLCAHHLKQSAKPGDVIIKWLPELLGAYP
jgi:hypothetical protein